VYVAARFHISHRFEVIADFVFKFGTKNGHFAFFKGYIEATYAVRIRLKKPRSGLPY